MSRIQLATLARALFWAGTWGVGVAIGVALGGWLTVVGSVGAPGAQSLELVEDVLKLPGLAGAATFILHLVGQAVFVAVRARRGASSNGHSEYGDGQYDGGEQITRKVGSEIEPPAS